MCKLTQDAAFSDLHQSATDAAMRAEADMAIVSRYCFHAHQSTGSSTRGITFFFCFGQIYFAHNRHSFIVDQVGHMAATSFGESRAALEGTG